MGPPPGECTSAKPQQVNSPSIKLKSGINCTTKQPSKPRIAVCPDENNVTPKPPHPNPKARGNHVNNKVMNQPMQANKAKKKVTTV